MKVGIITINDNTNFGNRLQNYALSQYLKKNGFDVKTIWFISKKQYLKNRILTLLSLFVRKNRKLKFYTFTRKYIDCDYMFKYSNNLYDKFIVGSDQVWNPYFNTFDKSIFLNFSPKQKNISYAASFGVDSLPSDKIELYKNGLKNFSHISVREKKGVEIINNIDKTINPSLVLDPTFLLCRKEWEKIIKHVNIKKKYIFLYFLGEISKDNMDKIIEFSQINNFSIVNILDINDKYYNSGPDEFLFFIKNAELIITDSFHSCVFSMIFNKNFFVVDRVDKEAKMNSRIIQLISDFEMDNRYVKNIEFNNINIDYSKFNKILENKIEHSINYLLTALKK